MEMTFISFSDIPPHEPPLQASSRPIPRIRIWPILQPVFAVRFVCMVTPSKRIRV